MPLEIARSRYVVALMRRGHVREVREERLVVRVDTVTEQVVRGPVWQPERAVQERAIALCERPEVDVDDVVLEPAAVRVSRQLDRKSVV